MTEPVKRSEPYKSPHKLTACSVGVGPEATELLDLELAYALGCTWLGVTQLEVDPAHSRAFDPGLTSFTQVNRTSGTKRVSQQNNHSFLWGAGVGRFTPLLDPFLMHAGRPGVLQAELAAPWLWVIYTSG